MFLQKRRPTIRPADRVFWVVLHRLWSRWSDLVVIVKPETVIGWHRAGFALYWKLPKPVAEWGRGTLCGQRPTRVARPCDHPRRPPSPPATRRVHDLLPRRSYSSSPREGRATGSPRRALPGRIGDHLQPSTGRRPAPPLLLASGSVDEASSDAAKPAAACVTRFGGQAQSIGLPGIWPGGGRSLCPPRAAPTGSFVRRVGSSSGDPHGFRSAVPRA